MERDALEPLTLEIARETADGRFDFGEFGHPQRLDGWRDSVIANRHLRP
jgi:hypothetical protein